MRIFGIQFETRRELKAKVQRLTDCLEQEREAIAVDFPIPMGATTYEVKLKGANGRFTTTKASKQHSVINEIIATPQNYFKLREKWFNGTLFLYSEDAHNYLDKMCID